MKLAFVFCAATCLVSFAGTSALHHAPGPPPQQEATMAVPSWLALPDSEYVTSIEYNGDPGSEFSRGAVTLDLPSDGEAEMAWLSAHFRAHGYRLEDRTSGLDQFGSVGTIFNANDDTTGRSLSIHRSTSDEGTSLRILFEDPVAHQVVSTL